MAKKIEITEQTLDVAKAINFISDITCGGLVVFQGVVRNNHKGKEVIKLNYTSHVEMSLHQIEKIISDATSKFGLKRVFVSHRIGLLAPGDTSIIVAVSAIHRDEAFKGARFIIDELKKSVPIWKEEFYKDGTKLWEGLEC